MTDRSVKHGRNEEAGMAAERAATRIIVSGTIVADVVFLCVCLSVCECVSE